MQVLRPTNWKRDAMKSGDSDNKFQRKPIVEEKRAAFPGVFGRHHGESLPTGPVEARMTSLGRRCDACGGRACSRIACRVKKTRDAYPRARGAVWSVWRGQFRRGRVRQSPPLRAPLAERGPGALPFAADPRQSDRLSRVWPREGLPWRISAPQRIGLL
jgi:hypothetical protein